VGSTSCEKRDYFINLAVFNDINPAPKVYKTTILLTKHSLDEDFKSTKNVVVIGTRVVHGDTDAGSRR
jgi:hypothetical protein